jgi:hypothetical protein
MEGRKDFEKIAQQILRQAMDDYIKLQHPKQRRKKYLKEAWWSANDLFFDPSFRLDNLEDDNNQSMSLTDFVQVAADRENVDLQRLRDYLTSTSKAYWAERNMRTVEIPSDVVVEGHAYAVSYNKEDAYAIDYDEKTIWLPASAHKTTQEEQFCIAVMEAVAFHTEAKMSQKARKQLAQGWFRALKVNNCFVGD